MKKIAIGFILLSCTAVAVACSSAAPGSDGNGSAVSVGGKDNSGDEGTLPASSDTKDELGIAKWGASEDDGVQTVKGYDEDGNVVATVTQEVNKLSDSHATVDYRISGLASGKLSMDVTSGAVNEDGSTTVSSHILANTLKGTKAGKIIDAIVSDQADKDWSSAGSGSLTTQSLHLNDTAPAASSGVALTTTCQTLTTKCNAALLKALGAGMTSAGKCQTQDTSSTAVAACFAKLTPDSGLADIATATACAASAKSAASAAQLTAMGACVSSLGDVMNAGADADTACAASAQACKPPAPAASAAKPAASAAKK